MPKIRVDMSNVEERTLVAEGDYICKVSKITLEDSQSGSKYLKWELTIGMGDYKGNKLWHNTSLKPNALWNLRNTILACGVECPKSAQTIDTDKFIGKVVGVTVAHEEYEGKARPKIGELWRAIKTESGWKRADQAAAKKVAEKPVEDEADEVDTLVTDFSDEIEEIEV
jgi:hypothetical protein